MINIMEPITKDQLQMKNAPDLVENYKWVEKCLPDIYRQVIGASNTQTAYTYDLRQTIHHQNNMGFNMSIYNDRLMHRLKELFPGCTIEYIESKSAINGNIIERAVRIDWS
jgi:hypothetical protein